MEWDDVIERTRLAVVRSAKRFETALVDRAQLATFGYSE